MKADHGFHTLFNTMEQYLIEINKLIDDFYRNYGAVIALYAPLGIVGLWRWGVYILKRLIGVHYRPTPINSYQATLSIVVPVYNESPQILSRAFESWIDNRPDEIVFVIDERDTRSQEVFNQFKEKYEREGVPSLQVYITNVEGKRAALLEGFYRSTGDIVAFVDSDTIWGSDIKRLLISPFADRRVGAVAPRQRVLNASTVAQRVYSIQLDSRYDEEMPFLSAYGDAVTCVSGRTAVFRRAALSPVIDGLVKEKFLGQYCISGDDKYLTRSVQANGWAVRYQSNATVYTNAAPDWKTYLKQKVRWTRNSWRSDLRSIFDNSMWIFRHKLLLLHTIDRFLQPFALILSPIFFVISIVFNIHIGAVVIMAWWFASRVVKINKHLIREPRDIAIIWHYIIATFVISLIKIYAWFSIGRQGWKTRWDRDRLLVANMFVRASKRLFAGGFTAVAVFSLTTTALDYRNLYINRLVSTDYFSQYLVDSNTYEDNKEETLKKINDPEAKTTYRAKPGENLRSISRKFNISITSIQSSNPGLSLDGSIAGQVIRIRINDLRNQRDMSTIESLANAEVSYTPVPDNTDPLTTIESTNILRITGPGAVITIPEVYELARAKYPDLNLIEKADNNEWILNVSLAVGPDVILVIDGEDVSWLKLKSDRYSFVWLVSFDGGMYIKDTKITSWDPERNTYDTELGDEGRSFILTKDSGRTDIINSELAYLGYSRYLDYEVGYPFGGVYGVAWRIQTGTYNDDLITGNMIDSLIHHNQFGVYTFGASAMVFSNNVFRDNIQYGLDPHDDSNYFRITDNEAYNNGNHGIIVSKRCLFNVFSNNKSYNNEKHGIMMDQGSNYNLVENNDTHDNLDGIAVYDSHFNIIANNKSRDNAKSGIRLNVSSSGNYITANALSGNKYGIYLYDGASRNFAGGNILVGNRSGVYMRESYQNAVVQNDIWQNREKFRIGENADQNTIRL